MTYIFVEGRKYSSSVVSLYRVLCRVIRIKAAEGMNVRNNSFVIDDVVIAFKEREYKWTLDDKWSSANARGIRLWIIFSPRLISSFQAASLVCRRREERGGGGKGKKVHSAESERSVYKGDSDGWKNLLIVRWILSIRHWAEPPLNLSSIGT